VVQLHHVFQSAVSQDIQGIQARHGVPGRRCLSARPAVHLPDPV
jgi:hypothetical protein